MRWDAISVACYGVPGNAGMIIAINPLVPIGPFVAGGTQLIVPVIPLAAAQANNALLPPWKRS